MRKREVLLSRINVYITVLMVSCHTVRIIPTVWDFVQTVKMDTDTQVRDNQEVQTENSTQNTLKDFLWPQWLDLVTTFSHLSLTISCSLSFYIYYFKRGPKKQVLCTESKKLQAQLWYHKNIRRNHFG